MREFGPIDAAAERDASATLFFREVDHEGKTQRVATANYLAFLSLRGTEARDEVSKLRSLLSEPSTAELERDIARLLRARNWRFHNIACVAIAAMGASTELLDALWSCIHFGSWTSPQLAATAAYVDPNFVMRAQRQMDDRSTYYKSIASLAALLPVVGGKPAELSPLARSHFSEATEIDRDNSGAIAPGWFGNLVESLGPPKSASVSA